MTGDKSFAEMAAVDFIWPVLGDSLLIAPSRHPNSVKLNQDNFLNFTNMSWGYELAANNLADYLIENKNLQNFMIYPLIFIYRHCLELKLKQIILEHGPEVGVEPNFSVHDLKHLWRLYEQVLEGHDTEKFDDAYKTVRNIVDEFSRIDPKSFSFRYPCDTKGNRIAFSIETLNVLNFKGAMKGAFSYFTAISNYLSEPTYGDF